jgi:hypothetical protein
MNRGRAIMLQIKAFFAEQRVSSGAIPKLDVVGSIPIARFGSRLVQ